MRSIKLYPPGPVGTIGTALAIGLLLYGGRAWGENPEAFCIIFPLNILLISLGHKLDQRFNTRHWFSIRLRLPKK